VAYTLNAGGVKLWQSANVLSSSTLSGPFTEAFLEEADSIRPERVGYCALHELDDPPTIQDPPEILGFRFSPCFCPRRTQLVVTLLEALLSKSHEGNSGAPYRKDGAKEVCALCFRTLPL
jgi:hypothetical protein